jgi:hypothetical protein
MTGSGCLDASGSPEPDAPKVIPLEQMYATEGNLMDSSGEAAISGPEFYDFDLALISIALHHLEDPAKGVKAVGGEVEERGRACYCRLDAVGARADVSGRAWTWT